MKIEFKDKVYFSLFKQFALLEKFKKEDLGRSVRDHIIKSWFTETELSHFKSQDYYKNSRSLGVDQEGRESDFRRFVDTLTDLLTPQETGVIESSRLHQSGVDLLDWYEVQNMFHAYFTEFDFSVSTGEEQSDKPICADDHLLVLRALKVMIHAATNYEYFSLVDCIYFQIEKLAKKIHSGDVLIMTLMADLFEIVDIVHVKLVEKKHTLKYGSYLALKSSKKTREAQKAVEDICSLMISKFYHASLMILQNQNDPQIMTQLVEQRGDVAEIVSNLQDLFKLTDSLKRDAFFKMCAEIVAFTMNSKYEGLFNKKEKFEQFLIPKDMFKNLILITEIREIHSSSLDVLCAATKTMWRFTQLDLHPDFHLSSEKDNPYYKEACNYFSLYAKKLMQLAGAQQTLDTNEDMMEDSENQPSGKDLLKSQKYLHYFLKFLDLFVRIRTRSLQQQLYPQLTEPLIQIITVLPSNGRYWVNLGSQRTALKILKEITKSQTFDDSTQLERLIQRLKTEFTILKTDMNLSQQQWIPDKRQDMDYCAFHSLARRQEFISTGLRFLCYSIIRTDPNNISVNQNFVAHSRKILDSCLFEDTLKDFVFAQNPRDSQDSLFMKVVDPVFLNCVQLFIYVINDLPQKIPEFLQSGLITSIVKSLETRIPLQLDVFQIISKFLRMLTLNQDSLKLLLESTLIEQFVHLALDSQSYRHIVMPVESERMFAFRSLIHSLANENQQLSDRLLNSIFTNMLTLKEEAWTLTQNFLDYEAATVNMTDAQKMPQKDQYGKKQVQLEQKMENAVIMLSYMVMDELEYIQNLHNHQSCVKTSLTQQDRTEDLIAIVTTPILASAADNFIYHFAQSATFMIMVRGNQAVEKYLAQLLSYIKGALKSIKLLLGVDDFDKLDTIDIKHGLHPASTTDCGIVFAENEGKQRQEMCLRLKKEDQLWVIIAKLHIYLELFSVFDNMVKAHVRLLDPNIYHKVIESNDFIGGPDSIMGQLFKFKFLLSRFHTHIFVDAHMVNFEKRNEVIDKFRSTLESMEIDWDNYKVTEEPNNELDEARNLYHRFEHNLLDSLDDKRATRRVEAFDVVFPDTEEVVQTFKCYKKASNILTQLRSVFNKKKLHINQKTTSEQIQFNQLLAQLHMHEIKMTASKCVDMPSMVRTDEENNQVFNPKQLLLISLEIDRVVPDITRMIQHKAKMYLTSGVFVVETIKMGLIEQVGVILSWAINQIETYQAYSGKKVLWYAENIQVTIKHCIDLLWSLVNHDLFKRGNLHNMLLPFRQDPTKEIKDNKQSDKEYYLCVAKVKQFFQTKVFLPTADMLFKRIPDLLAFGNKYSQTLSTHLPLFYQYVCKAFKDSIFSEQSLDQNKWGNNFNLLGPTSWHQAASFNLGARPQLSHNEPVHMSLDGGPGQGNVDQNYVDQLVQMGFAQRDSEQALRNSRGDFEQALDSLLLNLPQAQSAPSFEKDQSELSAFEQADKKEKAEIDHTEENVQFEQSELQVFSTLLALIENTLVTNLSCHFAKVTQTMRLDYVNKVFQLYKQEQEAKESKFKIERVGLLTNLLHNLFTQIHSPKSGVKVPNWLVVYFTKQIFSNQPHKFIKTEDTKNILLQQISLMESLAPQLKNISVYSNKVTLDVDKPDPKDVESDAEMKKRAEDTLFDLYSHMKFLDVVLYSIESKKEIDALKSVLGKESSELQGEDLAEIAKLRQELQAFNTDPKSEFVCDKRYSPLVQNDQDAAEILKSTFKAVVTLMKSLTEMTYSFVSTNYQCLDLVLQLLVYTLMKLSQIQTVQDFDFKQEFIANDTLRVLFSIKMIDHQWLNKKESWSLKSVPQKYLKVILEGVWSSPKDLQKFYETLIKRQMYTQFKQNYMQAEKKTVKEFYSSLIEELGTAVTNDKNSSPQPIEESKSNHVNLTKQKSTQQKRPNLISSTQSSTSKKSRAQSRSKSEEKQKKPSKVVAPSSKNIKKLIKKYDAYNETTFSELLQYFNSHLFNHNINNFQVFLAAFSKVCIIKQEVEKEEEKQEQSAFEQIDTKPKQPKVKNNIIMLKRQVLKEVLSDPDFNSDINGNFLSFSKSKVENKNTGISKVQQELVVQLMEILITQTKGYKMDILQFLKHLSVNSHLDVHNLKYNEAAFKVVKEDDHEVLTLDLEKTKCQRQIYFFDCVQILEILQSMMVRSIPISRVILRHNDSKTIKFLFRNLYFLVALNVQNQIPPSQKKDWRLEESKKERRCEIQLKDSKNYVTHERLLTIVGFFMHLLFCKYSSSRTDKLIKAEFRQIFVSQMAKNLMSFQNQAPSADKTTVSELQDSARLFVNFGPVWLLSKVMLLKHQNEITNETKDPVYGITQRRVKYWRLQVAHMLKLLILECQSKAGANFSTSVTDFVLLKQLERITDRLQDTKFFFVGNKIPCLHMCIYAITKIMKLFENSQDLFLKSQGKPPADFKPKEQQSDQNPDASQSGELVGRSGIWMQQAHEDEHSSSNNSEGSESQMDQSNDYDSEMDVDDPENDDLSSHSGEDYGSEIESMEGSGPQDGSYYNSWDDEDGNNDSDPDNDNDIIQLVPIQESNQQMSVEQIKEARGINQSADEASESGIIGAPIQGSLPAISNHDDGGSSHDSSDSNSDNSDGYDPSYDQEDVSMMSGDELTLNNDYYEEDNYIDESDNQEQSQSYEMIAPPDAPPLQAHDHGPACMHNSPFNDISNFNSPLSTFFGGSPVQEWPNDAIVNLQEFINQSEQVPEGMPDIGLLNNTGALQDKFANSMNMKSFQQSLGLFGTNVITWFKKIQTLKKKLKQVECVYKLHITTFSSVIQQQEKLTEDKEKEDKDDQIVTNNPDQFKDHMKQEVPTTVPQQPATAPQPSSLEIEGMDPLFMQALSPRGLQNIADSHQIHNQIQNQAQSGSFQNIQSLTTFLRQQTPQRRTELLRQIENSQLSDLPQDLYAEARNLFNTHRGFFREQIARMQQSGGNNFGVFTMDLPRRGARASRPRLVSFDSVTISVQSNHENDRSMTVMNDESVIQQQPSSTSKPKEPEKKPMSSAFKASLRASKYIQNLFNAFGDMNSQLEDNSEVKETDHKCAEIIKQALLPQDGDSPQVQFNKIKGAVNVALTGFKMLTEDLQLIQSIRILHRIPNMRMCIVLSVLSMMTSEVHNLHKHIKECQQQNSMSPYKSDLVCWQPEDTQSKQFMNLYETFMVGLTTIGQMQITLKEIQGNNKFQMLDIALPLNQNHLHSEMANLIGCIDTSKSVVESTLDALLQYIQLSKEYPWLMPASQNQHHDVQKQEFQERCIESIAMILLPVQSEAKQQNIKLQMPVVKLCDLFLNKGIKMNKKNLVQVKKILNSLEDQAQITTLNAELQDKLQDQLKLSVGILKDQLLTYSDPLTKRDDISKLLQSRLENIQEILKVATGVTRIQNQNICNLALLDEVLSISNDIVQHEQLRTEEDKASKQNNSKFMFKDEIKELMLLLFSLCEYNFKLIFNASPLKKESQVGVAEGATSTTESPVKGIETSAFEESKDQVDELVAKHMPKDSSEFNRFRSLVSFFISNKKVINMFIRVNQQVVNNELKNLAMRIPLILEFDTKRLIWRQELKKMHAKYKSNRFDIKVRRERVFDDSFQQLKTLTQDDEWKRKFVIEFEGEDGIDEGGLIKEWFSLLNKELFNENLALFIKSANGNTYFPNPKSTVQPNYLELFTFAGKLVGKALWDQQLLDAYFVKAFYKMILNMPLNVSDLEDYDQALFKSLQWMLDNQNVDVLCSYFVETIDYFGEPKEIELIPGGADVIVTDENKQDYVQKVANFRLYKAIQTQIDAFMAGFYSIVPKDLIKIFDNQELELLISGLQNIDIDDLRENTMYIGYTPNAKPVLLLWEALQEMDNADRSEFIQFVTGSSKVPVEGFKGLRGMNGQKFTIAKVKSTDRLPQSHTCNNQLDLPEYKDKETTKRMILMAIKHGKTFAIA